MPSRCSFYSFIVYTWDIFFHLQGLFCLLAGGWIKGCHPVWSHLQRDLVLKERACGEHLVESKVSNQRLSSFMTPSTTRLRVSKEKACGELDETIKNRDHELEFRRKKACGELDETIKKSRRKGGSTSMLNWKRGWSLRLYQVWIFVDSSALPKLPTKKRKQDSINGDFVMCFFFYVHQLAKNLCSFVVCSTVTRDFGLGRKTTGYWDIHRSQMKVWSHCGSNDTDRKAFAVSPSTRRQLSKEGPTNIVSLGPQEQDLEKKFANIVSLGPQEQEIGCHQRHEGCSRK